MTSDRQNDANRNNALKSTGPRTENGKAVAAKNALRHGLSTVKLDPGLAPQSRLLSDELRRAGVSAPEEASELILHIAQIRRAKTMSWRNHHDNTQVKVEININNNQSNAASHLKSLTALDGYERKARSRLKKVMAD